MDTLLNSTREKIILLKINNFIDWGNFTESDSHIFVFINDLIKLDFILYFYLCLNHTWIIPRFINVFNSKDQYTHITSITFKTLVIREKKEVMEVIIFEDFEFTNPTIMDQIIDDLASVYFLSENFKANKEINDFYQNFKTFIFDTNYIQTLEAFSRHKGIYLFPLNYQDINTFDYLLYKLSIKFPMETLNIMQKVLIDIYHTLYNEILPEIDIKPFNCQPFDVDWFFNNHSFQEPMISCNVRVISYTQITPKLIKALYVCSNIHCKGTMAVEHFEKKKIACEKCKHLSEINIQKSQFINEKKLIIKLKNIEVNFNISVILEGLLAETDIRLGQEYNITGQLKVTLAKSMKENVPAIFAYCITAKNIIDLASERASEIINYNIEGQFQNVDENLVAFLRKEDKYTELAEAIAPEIYGYLDLKKALLIQQVGGYHKSELRSNIHIAIYGEPGTCKSQLLSKISNIQNNSVYVCGTGLTGVGLTASIEDGMLKTGAIPQAHGSVCCIDEFDKINNKVKEHLLEVMESEKITINKSRFKGSFGVKTSVLASGNFKNSDYDENITIYDNITEADTITSRFDIIFLLKDPEDVDIRKSIGKHIVKLYIEDDDDEDAVRQIENNQKLVKDYIKYVKKQKVTFSEEAYERIIQIYVSLRNIYKMQLKRGLKTLMVCPRTITSFIRLSEGFAKIRLSDIVIAEDVNEILRLYLNGRKEMQNHQSTIDLNQLTSQNNLLIEHQFYRIIGLILLNQEGDSIEFNDLESKLCTSYERLSEENKTVINEQLEKYRTKGIIALNETNIVILKKDFFS